jgi:hypothetical protein
MRRDFPRCDEPFARAVLSRANLFDSRRPGRLPIQGSRRGRARFFENRSRAISRPRTENIDFRRDASRLCARNTRNHDHKNVDLNPPRVRRVSKTFVATTNSSMTFHATGVGNERSA